MAKKQERTELKKAQSTFQLIGEAKITDFTFKIDETSQKSDWIYNQLNLGVDCGNGNVVYADMMGGYGSDRDNILYVHGVKKDDNGKTTDDYESRFTIDWDDRTDEDILETIGNQCFLTVGLEKDKNGNIFAKKFLSAYDAIEYVKEHLESGMVVNVKGNLKYTIYNDSVQVKKEIKSIFASKVDDNSKYRASFTQTMLLDKDSVGKLDREKAVYPISAKVVDYTKMYNNVEVKQNVPFTKVFELEVDKEKPENTKKFIDKVLKVKKDITEVTIEGDIIESQTLVSITEADIPADIMELIEIGAYTMEDAIAKLAVGGSKEKRLVIRKPSIKMVGDEDSKKPVILKTESKYKEEDLIFDFMFEDKEEEEPTNNKSSKNDKSKAKDEEPVDWMKALDDEEDDLPF
jgi:hypothetical protein